MKVTIFFTTSTAFQYMSLYILVVLLLLLLSSPLQLFNTGSLLLKISLYYFEVTKFLKWGDKIFPKQAPSLLNPSVNFQKFTGDFYRKGRKWPAAYIKGLQHLSSEGAMLLLRSNVLPPIIYGVSDTFGCIGQRGKTLETEATIINLNG